MLNKTKLEGKTKEEILNKYLSENNLEEIAFIAEASARLIANRASFKLKFDRISKLVKALEMELEGANE